MKNMSIGFRLNGVVAILLFTACASISALSVFFAQDAFENEIISSSLPSKTAEVISAVDKQLVSPAMTLKTIARLPMLVDWIENGEDKDILPMIFKTSSNIMHMHKTLGVNLITYNSLNFYELSKEHEKVKKVDPKADSWFFAFEQSGRELQIDLYGPNDPHYPNMVFIDHRIDDKDGKFLGLIAVGMNVAEFIKQIGSNRIGQKGITFLARKNGEIMLHADEKLNGSQLSSLPGFREKTGDILSSQGTTFETVDATGENILVSTREIPILNAVVITVANRSELFQPVNNIKKFAILAGVGILVVSFLILTLFAKTITRPMYQILRYGEHVAAEREAESPPPSSVSEIEELRQVLNNVVKSMAERLLMVTEKGKEAEEALARSKEAATLAEESQKQERAKQERMLHTSKQLENIVAVVSSASEQLSAQIEQSSKGTDIQRERVTETATAMEEMNSTVMEVARNASGAAEGTDAARIKAQDGRSVVVQAIDAISQVQNHTVTLKENMQSLGQQAEDIGQVMNVISDIADQTNLLALNAAIEAARAGEAGRGFAVVADEVRKLAEKTMSATKEVGDAISNIQQGTRGAVLNMDEAAKAVEQATNLASNSGRALGEIVGMVEKASDQVRSIATASEEQSASSEEINMAIGEINRVSTETAEAMTQSVRAVSDLARLTQELNVLIQGLQDS